jgi:hypothetical protein
LYWQAPAAETETVSAKAGEIRYAEAPRSAMPPASLVFVGMTPCRLVDTRPGSAFTGAFGPPSLIGAAARTFPLQSSTSCGTNPATAAAYSLNVTVVPPAAFGFLTIWPTGQARPLAFSLNNLLGTVLANAVIVLAGTSGSVDVYVSNHTDLVIDINGYSTQQSGITLAQGTAAAPPLSFAGDPGTGIFSSGAGTVNVATNGTNRVAVDSTGNVTVSGNVAVTGATDGIVFPDNSAVFVDSNGHLER